MSSVLSSYNFARFGIHNAKVYPDKPYMIYRNAVENTRKEITWKQFNDETNMVANYMQKELGVKKGDFVLHLQMNSPEWIVTFFAILRCGASAVPLNFRFDEDDIIYSASACVPTVFIVDEQFLKKIQKLKNAPDSQIKHYICIGKNVPEGMIAYDDIIKNGDTTDVLVDVAVDDLAELMFTSGTTGAPKPVYQSHDTLYQIALGNALTFNQGHETVYYSPHPFFHSGAFFLGFPCYIAGGTIVVQLDLSPKSLMDTFSEEKVDGCLLTVPTMSDLIKAIQTGEIKVADYDLSKFGGYMVVGAQPVPSSLFVAMKENFPFKVANIYGITEGGGGGTMLLRDEYVLAKPGSIGKPTYNTAMRIVDDNGVDVPKGEVGEILLGGPRNMKGYYNNPEMTLTTLKDGWLYTGDMVREDEEGYVFLADRKKDLIIRGGENIFPAEIEDVLRGNPKIADVAVIGYPHERLVEICMAIVTLYPGETMDDKELLDFCSAQKLAKYKWPEKIAYDVVIRNATGKIDKPKLREKYIGSSKVITGN